MSTAEKLAWIDSILATGVVVAAAVGMVLDVGPSRALKATTAAVFVLFLFTLVAV